MRANSTGWPSFVFAAIAAIALTSLLVRMRYELESVRETDRTRTLLESAANELAKKLETGERATLVPTVCGHPPCAWRPWSLDASGYHDVGRGVPPIPEADLRQALAPHLGSGNHTLLLGPFATDAATNALVLARRASRAANSLQWVGAWRPVNDIVSSAPIADIMRRGYRLQLYDATQGTALYQSDDGELRATITLAVPFGSSSLQLRAAPRGHGAAPAHILSSSLTLLLALVFWLSHELRRNAALRRSAVELADAEERRSAVTAQYGKALESLAAVESRLQLVTLYDTVTGLPNRSALVRRIDTALESMRQSQQRTVAVMALGFDHLPEIARSFGAEFSSRVLVIAAERLEFILPSKDLLFRTGDFQLAVVLPDADAAQAEKMAERIAAEVESPIALGSHTFLLLPRIGIVETVSGYDYAETLLDHANAALDAVPRDSPQQWRRFDAATSAASVGRLQLEADLERALEENQFVLEYEPFIAAANQEVAGFEALIRWYHPTEGRISPGRFLPIALQSRLSHRLNAWVMREAARQASVWRRAGYRDLFINFNLNAEAFLRPQLADEVAALLTEFSLPGSQLVIELTEATLVQDLGGTARTLQRLAELGVNAWLDDFGTGYSSLSHLRTLPLKGVKIDRSFIERIEIESRDFGFLKALIDLVSYLGMQSVAEGIETFAQYELVALTTCDLYQGHHFAPSMPAEAAERWMSDRAVPEKREAIA
ncbi:MAG TPA: EAL domain-containing protein [Steroidobacteraceae bacterium]|jgi:diguanylate cyclase (GGDEF)-like protein|nr:EAL domain-containing protein [Steroidobacteraceae bacterium]